LLTVAWVGIVVAVWCGLVVPYMTPTVRAPFDLGAYFFPKFVYGSEVLRAGHWPLWNPYELCGTPFLGTSQSAVLYLLRAGLFAVLDPTLALHVFMTLHWLLLGVGVAVMMRALHVGWHGAVLAAIVATFQPLMLNVYAPHWVAGFAWVPWVLAAFLMLLERPTWRAQLGLVTAASCLVLTGYPEYAVDTALALIIFWLAALGRAWRLGSWAPFRAGSLRALLAGAWTLAITAVHWVPVVEMHHYSFRNLRPALGYDLFLLLDVVGSGRWWEAVPVAAVYAPPIVLGLALVAGRVGISSYRLAMVALAVISVAALSVLRTWPPFAYFATSLSWVTIFNLPVAALAGEAFDGLVREQRWRRHVDLMVIGLAGILVVIPPFSSWHAAGWLAVASVALLGMRASSTVIRAMCPWVVIVAVLGEILTFVPSVGYPAGIPHRLAAGRASYPNVDEVRRQGDHLRALCGIDGRVLAPYETLAGVPLLSRLRFVQGYPESLRSQRIHELLVAVGIGPLNVSTVDWGTLLKSGTQPFDLLDLACVAAPPRMQPYFERLGFTVGGRLDDGRVVFRRPTQHAVVVGAVRGVRDAADALRLVRAPWFEPHREVVIEGSETRATSPSGTLRGGRDVQAGVLRYDVSSEAGGYLVVSEAWYPGWRAWIDGTASSVVRANFAFMAVSLPPGDHHVELRYWPVGFGWAIGASALGMAVWLAGAIVVGARALWRRR
jgi:hypothetical protein